MFEVSHVDKTRPLQLSCKLDVSHHRVNTLLVQVYKLHDMYMTFPGIRPATEYIASVAIKQGSTRQAAHMCKNRSMYQQHLIRESVVFIVFVAQLG